MTHRILKSVLDQAGITDAEAAINNFAAELAHWKEREEILAKQGPLPAKPEWQDFGASEDPATDYARALTKWKEDQLTWVAPIKKPIGHPDIVSAVNDEGKPDFEIINDDPTDDDILRHKKDALLNLVAVAEHNAVDKVLAPYGKRRLHDALEGDYLEAQNTLRAAVSKKLGKDADPKVIEADLKKLQPAEHVRHLQDQQGRRDKIKSIARKAAHIMSDIEDLTLESVDSFVIPSFD